MMLEYDFSPLFTDYFEECVSKNRDIRTNDVFPTRFPQLENFVVLSEYL